MRFLSMVFTINPLPKKPFSAKQLFPLHRFSHLGQLIISVPSQADHSKVPNSKSQGLHQPLGKQGWTVKLLPSVQEHVRTAMVTPEDQGRTTGGYKPRQAQIPEWKPREESGHTSSTDRSGRPGSTQLPRALRSGYNQRITNKLRGGPIPQKEARTTTQFENIEHPWRNPQPARARSSDVSRTNT